MGHNGVYLFLRPGHVERAEVQGHGELLMAEVHVYVRIRAYLHAQGHQLFHDHETDFGSRLSLFIYDAELVVAAQLQLGLLVGYGCAVVYVWNGCVDRHLIIFYRLVVESLQPFHLKEFAAVAPVSLAVFYVIGVLMIDLIHPVK